MKPITSYLCAMACLLGCAPNGNFDPPEPHCPNSTAPSTDYATVKALYRGQTIQITEDWMLEGYVASSDAEGHFFGEIHIQDRPKNPVHGFKLAVDLRDTYRIYPPGSRIWVRLQGLYLGMQKGSHTLGGVFSSFGKPSVGRLPAALIPEHLIRACGENIPLTPTERHIAELDTALVHTLVRLPAVEIAKGEDGTIYAPDGETTDRHLTDCDDHILILRNSGHSNFHQTPLPQGQGSATGVLIREKNTLALVIRTPDDLQFHTPRCAERITEFSSKKIFISELADPDNNSKARFVELYNADSDSLSLNNWKLHRYTNANTEISATTDLSGHTIAARGTLLLSPNAETFETIYGLAPHIAVSGNSPADSNGDDTLVLEDPFGVVIDIFGVVGEDGSGTDHEFEDGRALRRPAVQQGNPTYNPTEWILYNDTGAAGTIALPQQAPEDFTPGQREPSPGSL